MQLKSKSERQREQPHLPVTENIDAQIDERNVNMGNNSLTYANYDVCR